MDDMSPSLANKFLTMQGENLDIVELDCDADYEMFLKHLRIDDNSHVLEMINVEDNLPVFVKNGEDAQFDESEVEIQPSLDSNSIKGRRLSAGKRKWTKGSSSPNSGETSDPASRGILTPKGEYYHFVEIDGDASYEMFLKHLRVDDKSYVLEMINEEDGLPVFVKYEGEDEQFDYRELGAQASAHGNTSIESRWRAGKRKWTKGSLSTDSTESGETIWPCSLPISQEVECPNVNEDYQFFLSHLRTCNDSMILEMENGVSVIYGEDSESQTASEVSETECTLYSGKETKPYESDHALCDSLEYEDGGSLIDDPKSSSSSYFEKKLMAILKKPYDQNEYEELLNDANCRRPVERERHLRGMTKSYETEKMGSSYLDYYPDIAQKIKSADCHGRLTLLRVFFFWLENLSHKGAFIPWKPQALRECQSINLRRSLQIALALD